MKNIDWALFEKQKAFLVGLAMATTLLNKEDMELLDGVIHLMDAVQDQQLYVRVFDQIRVDVANNDFTAIDELLMLVPLANLAAYLSEANEEAACPN